MHDNQLVLVSVVYWEPGRPGWIIFGHQTVLTSRAFLGRRSRKKPFPTVNLRCFKSFKNDFENNHAHIDDVPKGSMELTLPIAVQTVAISISISKKTETGPKSS